MRMRSFQSCAGFALLTVTLLVAVIGVISLAMVNSYLTNTRATNIETQRIKANLLLDSGVRFAALSLGSPRTKVSSSAIPSKRLSYRAEGDEVQIEIANEAGFIDLIHAEKPLLTSVLVAHGAQPSEVEALITELKLLVGKDDAQSLPRYRALRERLSLRSVSIPKLMTVSTLHNGQGGVHPSLAPESVLSLVPGLSHAEQERILKTRAEKTPRLISSPVVNQYFSTTVSAYYRVSVSVALNGQRYSKVQIIKMINQRGKLFEVQATL